ncbi:MAG TPA: SDR family oxidoreductase [Spongiibacteraceae bacterium]|nr:SDR family oxidoreductase [Spongiibacteraceae bacterium]
MSQLIRYLDKVVIVTGAASGIGQATVIRLVAEGGNVIGVDTNETGLQATVEKAQATAAGGGKARYLTGSVGDEATVKRIVEQVVSEEGRLDVLVNMAGVLRSCPATETTLDLFQTLLTINLVGTFLFCREALPHLLKTRGNIVNAASTSAQFGHPYMVAYAASKGGIFAMTRTLAWEYLKQGVRVNAVAPGGILTPLVMQQATEMNNYDLDLFGHLARVDGAFGQPENVAAVIAMLGSADGAHMTGEIVKIDGGVHN